MSLSLEQRELLKQAIENYAFPTVYYDFSTKNKVETTDMKLVEKVIKGQLTANDPEQVKYGLANVIYWGNANAGYQMYRTNLLLNGITSHQIVQFQSLVSNNKVPTLKAIKSLNMPQFSGISFLSKIITFLDPNNYGVMDLLISRLGKLPGNHALHSLKVTTGIAVNMQNSSAYYKWCKECMKISQDYFDGKFRAVDVERGFFSLIQNNKLLEAQIIYKDAFCP